VTGWQITTNKQKVGGHTENNNSKKKANWGGEGAARNYNGGQFFDARLSLSLLTKGEGWHRREVA
jgi:hypothetical protein